MNLNCLLTTCHWIPCNFLHRASTVEQAAYLPVIWGTTTLPTWLYCVAGRVNYFCTEPAFLVPRIIYGFDFSIHEKLFFFLSKFSTEWKPDGISICSCRYGISLETLKSKLFVAFRPSVSWISGICEVNVTGNDTWIHFCDRCLS